MEPMEKYEHGLRQCFGGDALSYWKCRAETAEEHARKAFKLESETRKKFRAAMDARNAAQAEATQLRAALRDLKEPRP